MHQSYGGLCPCALPGRKSGTQCAVANDQAQKYASPNWWYSVSHGGRSRGNSKQGVHLPFEPLLERVPQCIVGGPKEFKFLVGLDRTWVQYYNANRALFATQGYHSMQDSPKLMFDRVSYIFEQQFNIRLSIGRTVQLPELDTACETNNGYADGTGNTSIITALNNRGLSKQNNEAGILRLGVGVPSRYCHSYAPMGGLCSSNYVVNQWKPFKDSGGYLDDEAPNVLAHEFGHFFGICSNDEQCLNGHLQNEIPDTMVWDGTLGNSVRPEGMFWKFLTTCTHVYTTTLCKRARQAQCV